MANPIENLGDYNRVRIDLQAKNGDLNALYKEIGDIAIAKATPKILASGALIAIVAWNIGKKGICFLRERRDKLNNEPALKKRFEDEVIRESVQRSDRFDD